MKTYKIVTGIGPGYLMDSVNELLKEGWECQGGVSAAWMSLDLRRWWYTQAMTREEPTPNMKAEALK